MRDKGKDKYFGDRFRGKGEEIPTGVDERQHTKRSRVIRQSEAVVQGGV